MIKEFMDFDKTFKDFGYDARLLKPKSNKKVVAICPNCEETRILRRFEVGNLCKRCSSKINAKSSWKTRNTKIINSEEFLELYKIDVEKSINKLGNDPRLLTKGSSKSIICYCPTCGSDIKKNYGDLIRRGVRSCSPCTRKIVGLSNIGYTHTEESKKKMSKIHKNKTISDSHKKRISEGNSAKILTQETKDKISKTKIGKLNPMYGKSGVLSPNFGKPPPKGSGNGKSGYYDRINGETVYLRSSWELKFAIYLDEKRKNWTYESKKYSVNFFSNKDNKIVTEYYWPDFFVEGEGWYEIKGWWRDSSKAKFEAFKEQYPDEKITLLMKDDLKALGIDIK